MAGNKNLACVTAALLMRNIDFFFSFRQGGCDTSLILRLLKILRKNNQQGLGTMQGSLLFSSPGQSVAGAPCIRYGIFGPSEALFVSSLVSICLFDKDQLNKKWKVE